jgi:hypothetical protein
VQVHVWNAESLSREQNKGKLYVNRNRYESTPAGKNAQSVTRQVPGDITSDHVRNFLDCCKSRKRPNAHAAIAAISKLPRQGATATACDDVLLSFGY